MPSFNSSFYFAVNVYWALATGVAWSLCSALLGYVWGRRRAQHVKYMLIRESDIVNVKLGWHDTEQEARAVET